MGIFFPSYYVVSETKMFLYPLIKSCPFGTESMDFLAAAPGYQIIFGNPVDNCKVKTSMWKAQV